MTITTPEPLEARHNRALFESTSPELDDWLKNYAWQAHRGESTKVYVIHEDLRVVWFEEGDAAVHAGRCPGR